MNDTKYLVWILFLRMLLTSPNFSMSHAIPLKEHFWRSWCFWLERLLRTSTASALIAKIIFSFAFVTIATSSVMPCYQVNDIRYSFSGSLDLSRHLNSHILFWFHWKSKLLAFDQWQVSWICFFRLHMIYLFGFFQFVWTYWNIMTFWNLFRLCWNAFYNMTFNFLP